MGSPVVLQGISPMNAASEAVGTWAAEKRKRELEAQAQRYQQQRDARHDMESDRTFGLDKERTDDTHAKTQSELLTDQQNRDIAGAQEAYNEKMRPILVEAQKLQNKLTTQNFLTSQEQQRLYALQSKAAAIELDIKQRYGVKAAGVALKQAQANLAQTQATTASTNASTAETQYRMAHGADDYHAPMGRGGSATDRAQATYNDAINGLSPAAQEWYDSLYSTNNPPTRMQAMLALKARLQRGGFGFTATDGKNLETLIGSRASQFVTPGSQVAGQRSDDRFQHTEQRQDRSDAESEFRDVAKGKTYNALPPRLRDLVRHLIVDQHMDVGTAAQEIQGSSLDDATKSTVLRALNGG